MKMRIWQAMVVVSVLMGAGSAAATNRTWTQTSIAGANARWATGASWTPNGAPVNGDTVNFNTTYTSVINVDAVVALTTSGTLNPTIQSFSPSFSLKPSSIDAAGTGALTIGATVILAGTVHFDFAGTSNVISGAISGGDLIIGSSRNGTVALSNPGFNTFSSLTIAGGTLNATTGPALGSFAPITLAGGTLGLLSSADIPSTANVTVTTSASTIAVGGGGQHTVNNLTIPSAAVIISSSGGSGFNVGGTLSGSGTAVGTVISPGGGSAVTPGTAGIGTLTVGGMTLAPDTDLNYTIGTDSALLNVASNLQVNGVVNLTEAAGLAEGNTYTLIHDSGTMTIGTVTFGTVPAGFSYGLSQVGNDLILTVGPAPTAVGMASLSAQHDGHLASVTWQTGFETRNLGYQIYRQDGAQRHLLTPGLIAGSALRATSDTQAGRNYTWVDTTSPSGGTYWIRSIDLDGKREWFGPIVSRSGTVAADRSSAVFGDGSRPAPSLVTDASPVRRLDGVALTIAGDSDRQWSNAAGVAARVLVKESGVYRVTADQLFASGIPAGTGTAQLRVWEEGTPVSFRAIAADGATLQPGDAVEFFGRGLDARYSDTRHYWITTDAGAARPLTQVAPATGTDAGRSFSQTLEARERLYYFSAVKNGGKEKFFGPQVASTGLVRVFPTPALDLLASGGGSLEVAVQGLSAGTHAFTVSVNGLALGTLTGKDRQLMRRTFPLTAGVLIAGDNVIRLAAQSDSDILVESYQRLTYPRTYAGLGAPLTFNADAATTVRLVDFPAPSTRVFDVTDPDATVELTVTADPGNPAAALVNVPATGGPHTLFAFSPADVRASPGVQANQPSTWHAFQGAQLVILAHGSLLSTLGPLVEQRQKEGLSVASIDVQDVYDEFGGGEKDAAAITRFLQHASQHWSTPPRYVLIVGGATYDPRDYLGHPGLDLVPTNLIETVFLETGSDGRFAPGLAIGRWPVTTAAEAARVMDKTLHRPSLSPASLVLLVRDRDSAIHFSEATAAVRSSVPLWPVQEIARGADTDVATNAAILAAIRTGPVALDYQGHGAEDFWNGHLLNATDAPALAGTARPLLFSAATCFNGYFVDIGRVSLAQAMLLTDQGGAWAAWASSGMTSPVEHSQLSGDLFHRALVDGVSLGDAMVQARKTLTDPDVRDTFHLFGDPSAHMQVGKASSALATPAVQSRASGCSTSDGPMAELTLVSLLFLVLARRRRLDVRPSRIR